MMKQLAITVAVSATLGMGAAQADRLQIEAQDPNTLSFSLVLNGTTTNRTAGSYGITNTTTGESFLSFCVELLQLVQAATLPPLGLEFTSVDIDNYPTTPTGGRSDGIQALFDQRFAALDLGNFVQLAAFQIALWEITDDFNLTTGVAQGWNGNAPALSLASDWLNNLSDPTPTDDYNITAWVNEESQDMLHFAANGNGTVPEPGSLLLGLAGLAGLGFARRMR